MFHSNIPNMNLTQMNPMFSMNEMMNSQMFNQFNNIPYNQINQIPINNMNPQAQYLFNNNNDIDFVLLQKELDYNSSLNLKFLKDDKKTINFTNSTNTVSITINIPILFTKNELYSYINKCTYQKTVLFYENNILDNDESSIEDIPNNSTIILFPRPSSFLNFKSSSLYQYIKNNQLPNGLMVNICIKLPSEKLLNFIFPDKISVSLAIKLIRIALNLNKTDLLFWKSKEINIDDNTKIIDFFKSQNPTITIELEPFGGKKITATVFFKQKDISISLKVFKYDSISKFYKICLTWEKSEDMKILYQGKELQKDDGHSLASIGINSDFECVVE